MEGILDEKLIDKFRERVEKNDFVLHVYKNKGGKNKWNCICSAMDWISVSVHYLCSERVLHITKDENMNSVEVDTFLSCIDILWESIQQLHRVFHDTKDIPFVNEKKIFNNNQFSRDDNNFFKTVRACFGAHPVNLYDTFSGTSKERRFASWSGSFGRKDTFSVKLYGSVQSSHEMFFDINYNELWCFAEQRYNYLNHLCGLIERQEVEYIEKQTQIEIKKDDDPLKQIEILMEEVKKRSENDDYRRELKRLMILFSADIKGEKNRGVVEKYRKLLKKELMEIYENVQNMTFKEIQWAEELSGDLPREYHHYYSSICGYLFGSCKQPIGIESLNEYISEMLESNLWVTYEELYTLIEAMKYF